MRSKVCFYEIHPILCALALVTLACGPLTAQVSSDNTPENFRVEFTGSAWLVDTHGTIQSGGTPVDLVSDLGAEQQKATFFGRLVVKPGRKHRIVIEGMPFSIDGLNTVNRTIVYHGQTFTVNQTLRSSASLDYVFAGYQYDLLAGSMGHLGLSVGGAYLNAAGTITELQAGTTASKPETIGLPLAGAEGRAFLIPRFKLLQVEGSVRGMAVGSYGNYLEVSGSGGIGLHHVSVLAGYRSVNADLHDSSSTNPSGVNVHLRGPIFSVQGRW